MRLLNLLTLSALFLSPVFSQQSSLLNRLNELGLSGYAIMLAKFNPELVAEIGARRDITVYAPGNRAVAKFLLLNKLGLNKRVRIKITPRAATSLSAAHSKPPPDVFKSINIGISRRQVNRGPAGFPDSNFQTIITFHRDPDFTNLGPDQPVRFVSNLAAPPNQNPNSVAQTQIVTGSGNTQATLRGPFKFKNGVIYEVTDFFGLPQSFSETSTQLTIARSFVNTVITTGGLTFFDNTAAITIFAPIDDSNGNMAGSPPSGFDANSHIVVAGADSLVYYIDELVPGLVITARSGAQIKVTVTADGERLVNCRRLIRANIPIMNGVMHFIDGTLFGPGSC